MTGRCYGCDQADAVYEAHLDHDATPVVLLCDACAIWERDAGSVVWIRTLATVPSGHFEVPREGAATEGVGGGA